MTSFPKIILWAWERPENLGFIDPETVGVAFLAKVIFLQNDKTIIRPRVQQLSLPEGTILTAVVRIESSRIKRPTLSHRQLADVTDAIASLGQMKHISAIQIDYDAKKSERSFYESLLKELRHQLPKSVGLSITALASWCMHDTWLHDLPIDEAIPMLFRMGPDHTKIINYLKSGRDFISPSCKNSFGISTDEPLTIQHMTDRKLYVFHPKSWTVAEAEKILTKVRK